MDKSIKDMGGFIWSIANILRSDFKQSEYGKIILPFVVLRRLDCILENSKETVLETSKTLPEGLDETTRDEILFDAIGSDTRVYNLSPFTFDSLHGQDAGQIHQNLVSYIMAFSPNVRDIFIEKFLLIDQLKRLNDADILWTVFESFRSIDLHPDRISNIEMGYLFEDMIRRFSEISNETAGEHFTPREVIKLIVNLLIANDDVELVKGGIMRQVYDPACGTGGMLAMAEEALKEFNSEMEVELFGQEINAESFGICKSDMLITGHDPEHIAFGNTLTKDSHKDKSFHYMLSNPPYGVDWKKYQGPIKSEAEELGMSGRFGAGTPRISDGQFLFLQHMISKMRDDEIGSRIGIVMNGSPLFTGGAGSAESEIRRWMLENDWVEAIVALPSDLFYNTGIQTYIWILSNRKSTNRHGKVQLINAGGERFFKPMRKSLGSKRREIPQKAGDEIVRIYAGLLDASGAEEKVSCVFETAAFGYREIRVERPLKLNFQVNDNRISDMWKKRYLKSISKVDRDNIEAALHRIGDECFFNRDKFRKTLDDSINREEARNKNKTRKHVSNLLAEKKGGKKGKKPGKTKILMDSIVKLLVSRGLTISAAGQRSVLADLSKKGSKNTPDLDADKVLKLARFRITEANRNLIVMALSERDENAEICLDKNGNPEPDPELRDHELVPLVEDWRDYMKREVLPFVPDAWVDKKYIDAKDGKIGRVGYEINLNRYFYKYQPPRGLEEIDAELKKVEAEIASILAEVME